MSGAVVEFVSCIHGLFDKRNFVLASFYFAPAIAAELIHAKVKSVVNTFEKLPIILKEI